VEQTWIIDNVDGLPEIAQAILHAISPKKNIAFYGQMGAGKTTTVKALCSALGVTETTSSPTFAIVNTYIGSSTIYHFDLFRIQKTEELEGIGFLEYLETNNYVFIEWPELVEEILDEYEFARIKITTLDANSRQLHLTW